MSFRLPEQLPPEKRPRWAQDVQGSQDTDAVHITSSWLVPRAGVI